MELPRQLRPPVSVALARAEDVIPAPGRSGTFYEPKWDGWRGIVVVDDTVSIWSRQERQLTSYFPDIAAAVSAQVPPGTVLDGELVTWVDGRLEFGYLQARMSASTRRIAAVAARHPASYVAFDVLAAGGVDVRARPLAERRQLLEALGTGWGKPLFVGPATTEQKVASAWFEDMAPAGIEGIVAKPALGTYRGGKRDWVKVKRRTTIDVVLGAVIGPLERPTVAVAGLVVGDTLRIVGRTTPLSVATSKALGAALRPADDGHPWPEQVTSATVNGFGHDREPVRLTRVEPVVLEVSADAAWSGSSFRHVLRFVRLRQDLAVDDVMPPG